MPTAYFRSMKLKYLTHKNSVSCMKCAAVGRGTYYNQGNLRKTSFRRRALALPTVPWNGQEFEVLTSQTITLQALKAGGFIYPPQKHLSLLLQGDDSAMTWPDTEQEAKENTL